MSAAIKDLLAILELDEIDPLHSRGQSPQTGRQRVFGGQVISQAIIAANKTTGDARNIHSIHCYFMRPGDPSVPIDYHVEIMRDGLTFCTRRVVAIQHQRPIFALTASFQRHEDGMEHQVVMPENVPLPEDLLSEPEMLEKLGDKAPISLQKYWRRERPIELRPVSLAHYSGHEKLAPTQLIWVRVAGPIPDNYALQSAVLAYLSDMTLLDTALFAHGLSIFEGGLQVASLDHAMWFHRPCLLDDWLLYAQDSPSTSGARGFTRGQIFTRDGVLIASTAQEGLIRNRG